MYTTNPANRPGYIDPAVLRAIVLDYRATGVVSNDLGLALLKISQGVWDRYHYTDNRDDFGGDCVLHLLGQPLKAADPAKNLFSYFTTCVVHYGIKLRGKAQREQRQHAEYVRHVVEQGTPLDGVIPESTFQSAGEDDEAAPRQRPRFRPRRSAT